MHSAHYIIEVLYVDTLIESTKVVNRCLNLCWQPIVNYNVCPLPKVVEMKMEYPTVQLRFFWVPFLVLEIKLIITLNKTEQI
jgi:hypothetical protein